MAKKKLTFIAQIEERNGEQEYTFNYIVYAVSQEHAERLAEYHIRHWYDTGEKPTRDGDWYEFLGGALMAKVNFVIEISEAAFVDDMLSRYSIGKRPEPVKPAVLVHVAGGLVVDVIANHTTDVYIMDKDTEGADDDEIDRINGEDFCLSFWENMGPFDAGNKLLSKVAGKFTTEDF